MVSQSTRVCMGIFLEFLAELVIDSWTPGAKNDDET